MKYFYFFVFITYSFSCFGKDAFEASSAYMIYAEQLNVQPVTRLDLKRAVEEASSHRKPLYELSFIFQNMSIHEAIRFLEPMPEQFPILEKYAYSLFLCVKDLKRPKLERCHSLDKFPRVELRARIADRASSISGTRDDGSYFEDNGNIWQNIVLNIDTGVKLLNKYATSTYNITLRKNAQSQPISSATILDFFSIEKFVPFSISEKIRDQENEVSILDLLPEAIKNNVNKKDIFNPESCHEFALRFIRSLYGVNTRGIDQSFLMDFVYNDKSNPYFEIHPYKEDLLRYGDLIRFGDQHTVVYLLGGYVLMKDNTDPAYSYRFAKLSDFATDGLPKYDYLKYLQATPTHIFRWNGKKF